MFPIVLLTLVVCNNQLVYGEIKIGEIKGLKHDVGGTVYYVDDRTLKIKGFTYDGLGPDAFFLVGTEGSPSDCIPDGCPTATILPYPFNGTFYDYDDPTIPIIKDAFTGDKDITLETPTSLKTTDIKWFSVWSRESAVDFGHSYFDLTNVPKDVTPEIIRSEKVSEPATEVAESSQGTEKETETEPAKETNPGPETPDEITESSPGTSKDPTTQQENGSASFKTFSLLLNMLMIICGLMFLPSS